MNVDQIVSEWLQLKDSGFWSLYNSELDRMLLSRFDKLRNGAIDTILYTQGEVKSIEMVKTIPDRVLAGLKSNQGV